MRETFLGALGCLFISQQMMAQTDREKLEKRISNICMGRLAEPGDIAGACVFLASNLATYISGQVLAVDGCTIM